MQVGKKLFRTKMFACSYLDFASRGDERPVELMIFTWVFYIILPPAVLTLAITQNLVLTVAAALMFPSISILQGTVGILKYRYFFGDAPHPLTPSHGVVVVHPEDENDLASDNSNEGSSQSQCHGAEYRAVRLPMREPPRFLQSALEKPPIRVLVIGDSLAIGVGQRKSATPILPEAISKTLSKKLGGRIVYWSCHGAPGASTGWIVREIERGIKFDKQNAQKQSIADGNDDDDDDSIALDQFYKSSCSDTDSSSDESSSCGETPEGKSCPSSLQNSDQQPYSGDSTSLNQWKELLTQHRKRFDQPDSLGPYDVVVAMSGSNDLKSACFPFLLRGEDIEFRKQARERGGNYTQELRRLLETLNDKMQRQLETIRFQMEVATETVLEKVGETFEYISPGSSNRLPSPSQRDENSRSALREDEPKQGPKNNHSWQPASGSRPLVVLPGMCARAVPSFQILPLKFLSIPSVDIMDMHKRNFAKANKGDVMFVPAPSIHNLAEYQERKGEMWSQKDAENTILVLRDTTKQERRNIERDMSRYYREKADAVERSLASWFSWLYLYMPATEMFSVDQVHPCDECYDCWGRLIGNEISEELLGREKPAS